MKNIFFRHNKADRTKKIFSYGWLDKMNFHYHRYLGLCLAAFIFLLFSFLFQRDCYANDLTGESERFGEILTAKITDTESGEEDFIKWMDFNVPAKILKKALQYDVQSYGQDVPLNWIELLAYATANNWGSFKDSKKVMQDIDAAAERLSNGAHINDITDGLELYPFYLKTFRAVLGAFVGEYDVESDTGEMERRYGLKVFSPIANGYYYNHYEDFGASRSYAYRRKHLGNDLMGSVGTPIIAVEDGYVEALGWNELGGWRIGIRSADKKRYYYYAHLKKDHPFHSSMELGKSVQAGDVIGYLGMTGYSAKENTNNISIPHLHFGLQIIFDESQKDGNNQIWIDLYNLVELLDENKMAVYKDEERKDYFPEVKLHTIAID